MSGKSMLFVNKDGSTFRITVSQLSRYYYVPREMTDADRAEFTRSLISPMHRGFTLPDDVYRLTEGVGGQPSHYQWDHER